MLSVEFRGSVHSTFNTQHSTFLEKVKFFRYFPIPFRAVSLRIHHRFNMLFIRRNAMLGKTQYKALWLLALYRLYATLPYKIKT